MDDQDSRPKFVWRNSLTGEPLEPRETPPNDLERLDFDLDEVTDLLDDPDA